MRIFVKRLVENRQLRRIQNAAALRHPAREVGIVRREKRPREILRPAAAEVAREREKTGERENRREQQAAQRIGGHFREQEKFQFHRRQNHQRGPAPILPKTADAETQQPAAAHEPERGIFGERQRVHRLQKNPQRDDGPEKNHRKNFAVEWLKLRDFGARGGVLADGLNREGDRLRQIIQRMPGEKCREKNSGEPRAQQQHCPGELSRKEKCRHRQQPQIPHAMHKRTRGDERGEQNKIFRGRFGFLRGEQNGHQHGGSEQKRAAQHEALRHVADNGGDGQHAEPRFGSLEPRQRRAVHEHEQRQQGKNQQRFRFPARRALDETEQRVPAEVVVKFERVAEDKNIRP